LDIETIELLERELREYKAGVIIVGHDRAFLDNTCNTTWLVHNNEIEIFEGGYSQVAPYLQALQLEAQMPESKKKAATPTKVEEKLVESAPKKPKMSYKEKERFKVIEKEINTTETKVDELKDTLAAFDFSSPSDETSKKYESMNAEFSKEEKKLEDLYAEWEDLEGKEV
jgi:ATP-binding cassette subfamily F protein uup